jgi:hypothetical protein
MTWRDVAWLGAAWRGMAQGGVVRSWPAIWLRGPFRYVPRVRATVSVLVPVLVLVVLSKLGGDGRVGTAMALPGATGVVVVVIVDRSERGTASSPSIPLSPPPLPPPLRT